MTKRFFCCSLLLILCHYFALSQSVTINITSGTIAVENSATQSFTGGGCLGGILTLAPYVNVHASSTVLTDATTGKTIPVNKLKILVTQIGSTLTLGAGNQEITLSNADQTLYKALLAVSLGGTGVTFKARIAQTDMTNYGWEAGSYTVDLIFSSPSGTLCGSITTNTIHLTIVVDPYMNISTTTAISLQASTLANFRTTTPTATNSITINTSVPFILKAKGATSNFTYSPIAANASLTPSTPISTVYIQPQGLSGSSNINLSSSYQALSGTISVPTGNATTITMQHQISYTDLATYFADAGSYTVLSTYQINDARSSPTLTAATTDFNITETTADLQELLVNNSNVTLAFNNVTDYKNGVSVDMPSHISISKTTPLDVYVKASASTLAQGSNTIPASIITIKGTASQAGVTPVQLTTTAQKIYSAPIPIVNSSLSIQYAISAANVPQVLSKPAGDYITTITYSFVAP